MIKNINGNVLVAKEYNSGHVSIEIFQSEESKLAFETTGAIENEPTRSSIYIADKFQTAKELATSLDGNTYAVAEQLLLEQVVLAAIVENPTLLTRTRWDTIDFNIV